MCESEQFRIVGVRWVYRVSLAVQCIYGWNEEGDVKEGVNFLEDGREWRLPGLLYADDLVLCDELKEDLRVMVVQFAEVCRRRGLKVNASKSKVMVLNGEEGLECVVHIDGIHLKHVSEFKYLEYVLDD